jgi:hypothetical protein
MPVPMVVRVMMLVPMGMAVTMVVEGLMVVRVVVPMVMGTVVMIVLASRQQRPDAPLEQRASQTHHDKPRPRTQPRIELLGEHV